MTVDAVPLTGHIYTQLTPDQVLHRLTDDGWSSFDFGPLRVQVPTGDLTRIRAARVLAQAIAAQAGFWNGDLAAIEAGLVDAEQAKVVEHAETTVPQSVALPPSPDADAPFGGDDPELDARVQKIATLPETRRRTGPKPAPKPPKDET